jgi:UDP-N-acetylmuramoylalanine--D-glutamate ligase
LDHHGDRRGDRLHDLRAHDPVSRPALPAGPYLVVGLARSGVAAALALAVRGERVIGTDAAGSRPAELQAIGVELVDDPMPALERVGCVIKSPGVPAGAAVIAAARERGLTVIGELELAWRLLENRFVAVTGTNGKTTTVELIGAMYRASAAPVALAGNVGHALSLLATPPPYGEAPLDPGVTVVCEASSFQLEDTLQFAPEVALLLNVAPDHLDRHRGMEAYLAAKLRIFANQSLDDFAVLPAQGVQAPVAGHAQRLTFGTDEYADMRFDGEWVWWRGKRLVERSAIRLRGPHNTENAMAAATAALAGGLPVEGVLEALASFPGVAHRLEEVASVRGVLFVNDSKGTNVASTRVALRSFERRSVHLIVGGRAKGEDFGALGGDVAERARAVYLIGEAGPQIARALADVAADAGIALIDSGTLERALTAARGAASPGEVVLLSPACTSFDQFHDFEARGEEFRRLVLAAA